jgi:arginyl-tRNA synthetase
VGKEIVMENLGKIFLKDEGAIIFPGVKYNLHNRVFINSKGNPTYEGKDIGLQAKYQELYQYDQVNIFSHKEQDDYFKVIIKANEMVFPHLAGKIKHVSYGEVKLSTGKMSSRTGNVIAAEDIFNQVKTKIKEISPELDDLSVQNLAVGAIKFTFLKYSVGSDIVYDLEESVSIHGDTGPYVMYVYARIQSILRKAAGGNRAKEIEAEEEIEEVQEEEIAQKKKSKPVSEVPGNMPEVLAAEEREVIRQLEYFEIIVEKATVNFQPNELVKYLLNLTKAFNSFYEKHPVVGSKTQDFRLLLVRKAAESIKLGLYLLGIETVDKM